LFAGADFGLFVSRDSGATWTPCANLPQTKFKSIIVTPDFIFAGSPESGVFRSVDNGGTWIESNQGFTKVGVEAIAAKGKFLFAGTANYGIFRSSDNGNTWSTVNKSIIQDPVNFPYPPAINDLTVWQNTLFALIQGGLFQVSSGVYRSTDDGASWVLTNKGLNGASPHQLAVSGPNLIATVFGNGMAVAPLSDLLTGIRGPAAGNNAPGFDPFQEARLHPGSLISYRTSQWGWTEIQVLNAKGERAENLFRGWTGPGLQKAILKGSGLSEGRYFLRLRTSGQTDVHPFVLER
jgi:hypothetical protein